MMQETFQHISRRIDLLRNLCFDADFFKTLDCLVERIDFCEGRIFLAGNGGSAAIASHFSQGLADCGVSTVSLVDCIPLLTALSNDCGYANVFKKQLENSLTPKDIIVLISSSGNSQNIIQAASFAHSIGAFVISFTGFDGGSLKKLSSLNIHIETPTGEYAPVEDIHMMLCHIIEDHIRQRRRYSLTRPEQWTNIS